jgi:crotonobetainyl-CoA:carnitine CoA-transferase CaiB-like acyl-CoA transferase
VGEASTEAAPRALEGIRVCDLSGQLAGAGATRTLAAFGAEVIRIEDPVTSGKWDILRGAPPFVDDRRGNDLGGAFNQHNVEKLGITLNTRTARGRELLAELIRISDVVTENFSAEVLTNWGFTFEQMRALRPDVIYLSNCGFGHTGPYMPYRTWGPVVQALCGLTFSSGLDGLPPAGWGYSYMDHLGANLGVFAILAALRHRRRTGEGQWIDLATVEAGTALLGPVLLDWSVNGRGMRAAGTADSNHSAHPAMAPHNIYAARGEDEWVALACRHDDDWRALAAAIGEPWTRDERWTTLDGRLAAEHELDGYVASWTGRHDKFAVQAVLLEARVPAAAVQSPAERIDRDRSTTSWGLWPEVHHPEMGTVRVDGIPAHLSETDWSIVRGAPLLGQHNDYVYGDLLGLSASAIDDLRRDGVI